MRLLADKAIAGFKVRQDQLDEALARNPILVTALNPVIGYEKAAAIAKRAYAEGRPVLDVALGDERPAGETQAAAGSRPRSTKGGIGAGGGGQRRVTKKSARRAGARWLRAFMYQAFL